MAEKTPLLVLHGALGASAQMQILSDALPDTIDCHYLDFNGHGNRSSTSSNFSIAGFGHDVLQYLSENQLEQVHIFGYSMGGYVGMWLAANYPEKIASLTTLATKWKWSPEIAAKEVQMLSAETIRQKVPQFAHALQQLHGKTRWEQLLNNTAKMMSSLGQQTPFSDDQIKNIPINIHVLRGTRDKMVSLEESEHVASLPANGAFKSIPDTPHPFEKVDLQILSTIIQESLSNN